MILIRLLILKLLSLPIIHTSLSLSDHSPTKLEDDINTELTKIKSWLELNKLSLNVQKTSFMIFSTGRVKHEFVIKFGNSNLNQCAETKYLGVILVDKLSWIPHIKSVQKKVSSSTWALSRLQSFFQRKLSRESTMVWYTRSSHTASAAGVEQKI